MPHALYRTTCLLILLAAALVGCNFNPDPPTPTVEGFQSPTPTNATQEPSLTPSPSLTSTLPPTAAPIRLASATPSSTAQPQPDTPTPTETPGPFVHRVQPGEGLYSIISRYGYSDGSVFAAILAINPNVPNENSLPVGQDILIPRMTYTPTPPNYEATVAVAGTLGIRLADQFAENTQFECHAVAEGQSIIDIAAEYNTTIEILSARNPEISFYGCDFNIRSGGPNCAPLIQPGQCVQVPLPTTTPTLSPTPSGNETATPTPTYNPPTIIEPPNGAQIGGTIILKWTSVGLLKADEYYYVEVNDTTTGASNTWAVKDTSLRLPPDMLPPEGERHDMEWRVVVVRGQGESFAVIGGVMPSRTFKWQKR